MLLTLLGFSAACSTVRNSTDSGNDVKPVPESAEETPEMQVDTIRTIRLLYGVRRPEPVPETEAGTGEKNGSAKAAATEEPR